MSTESTLSLGDKIRLYLEPRGIQVQEYRICEEGKCWKDSSGRFTIKSRLAYIKESDGLRYVKSLKAQSDGSAIPEDEALKYLFYGYLKEKKVHLCNRCGGAGGAQHWPGYTCFDCNGTCIDPNFDFEDALANALHGEDFEGDYVAKVEQKRLAQAAEAQRVQEERIAIEKAQREKFLVDHAELFARCKSASAFLGIGAKGQWADKLNEFLTFETYVNRVPGQHFIQEAEEVCKKVEFQQVERDRQAAVSEYIGTLKERQDFTARVQFTKTFEREWGTSHLTVLHDDNGNVIKYWNLVNILDPQPDNPKSKRPAEKGERVTFSATVIEHEPYQGVKQTTVQRATKGKLA